MKKNQGIFNKQNKSKAISLSCILYFAVLPLLYFGIIHDIFGLMFGGLILIAAGALIDIVYG